MLIKVKLLQGQHFLFIFIVHKFSTLQLVAHVTYHKSLYGLQQVATAKNAIIDVTQELTLKVR